MEMPNIKKILKKVKALQPIPAIVHKILLMAEDPDSQLNDLVDIVEIDPAITANLLKMCNCAHMGLPQKVDSVDRALSLIGMQGVVELVLAQNLGANLQRAQKGYLLEKGELWKQSLAAAMVAKELANRQQLKNLPGIYTAALLKDIGKVVLNEFVSGHFQRIQRLVENKGLSFIEAEKQCVGMDHAQLGGIIAKQWNFSSHLIYMIENHHLGDPNARRDPSTSSIYLADMVAMMAGSCIGVDRLAYPVYEEVFKDYFLAREELKGLILAYEGYLSKAHHLFETYN
jgi:HD-like signal output (HDOD) protein